MGSPRFKFDLESNKFVKVAEKDEKKDKSITTRIGSLRRLAALDPVLLEKRRYNRQVNDEAAMKILAPNLNPSRPMPVLSDLT